jgi:DNA-binding response OmpR family regulator
MKNHEGKPSVLAVDDDTEFLKVLRLMLEPRYTVECLSDGEDLLDHLDVLKPDAMILDVHMPGKDGFRLCQSVRSDPRFAGMPVLFLTASHEDEDFVKNLRAGGDAWLNKPVGTRQLQDRLKELLAVPRDVESSWVERS